MAWYDDILGTGTNIFGASPPSYLGGTPDATGNLTGGLLTANEMDKLKQKSLMQGLLNTGLTYLAQPKNQRYGSALPYLAKAGLSGVQSAQGVYDTATQDYLTQAKIAELKQKQDQTKLQKQYIDEYTAQHPEMGNIFKAFPDAASKILEQQYKSPEIDKISPKDYTQASLQTFITSKNPADLVPITKPSDSPYAKIDPKDYTGDSLKVFNQSGNVSDLKPTQAAKGMYKQELDATGNIIFLPQQPNLPVLDATGKPIAQPNLPTKPMSESQANANIFAPRADSANKILKSLEVTNKNGQLQYSPTKLNIKLAAQNTIGIGAPIGALANTYVLGENEQKAEQAQRDFVNSVLRKESGAAISQSEFDNAFRQYFPQTGDSPVTIAQKQKNREMEIKGLYEATGKAKSSQNKSNVIDFKDL